MQTHRLVAHPLHPPTAVREICVGVEWLEWSGVLRVYFEVRGQIAKLRLPPLTPNQRADDLWRTTCFEAFLMPQANETAYTEHNWSPGTAWAAYQFDDYRNGRRNAAVSTPSVTIKTGKYRMYLLAAHKVIAKPGTIGLSAVIEETDGTLSYWALAHPDGPPDFHNRDCFIARLP